MFAEGIRLEDSKKILRWGCSRQEALYTGNPVIKNGDIEWQEVILDGLRSCTLIADLPKGEILNKVRVNLYHWPSPDHEHCVQMQYRIFSDHLTKKIGQPSIKPIGKFEIAPILVWQYDGCLLELVSADCGHPSFTILTISKEIK